MSLPEFLSLAPRTLCADRVDLPGSKSISNRVLLLAALAEGITQIQGLLDAEDTQVMLNALRQLGVDWQQIPASEKQAAQLTVTGCGQPANSSAPLFSTTQARLFMGNAGTALRPLTATLALAQGDYELYGVPRMHQRPIGDLVDALNAIGAQIKYQGEIGYPPLKISPATINAQTIRVNGTVSSQFLTALLLVSPLIAREQTLTIEVVGELISRPYIDITCQLMARFGVTVRTLDKQHFQIDARQSYHSPGDCWVEGDASSASYFLAASAITGHPLTLQGVGRDSLQGDIGFAQRLETLGVAIDWQAQALTVRAKSQLRLGDAAGDGGQAILNCLEIPDAAMTLAILALYGKGTTTLTHIGSWRVKETDRIAAMATELQKLGAMVASGDDWLRITPPQQMTAAVIETYDDHRMAMCFALTSLQGLGQNGASVTIRDPGCVAKTYPTFFDEFLRVTEPVHHG